MKRCKCSVCGDKLRVRSAGNVSSEKYQVLRRNRKGEVTQRRKVGKGSAYRLVLSCRCKDLATGRPLIRTVIELSRSRALGRLYRQNKLGAARATVQKTEA